METIKYSKLSHAFYKVNAFTFHQVFKLIRKCEFLMILAKIKCYGKEENKGGGTSHYKNVRTSDVDWTISIAKVFC